MRFTHLTAVSLLGFLTTSLALPVPETTAANVNVFDLSTSRVTTALKELSAEMSAMFTAVPADWNPIARQITQRADALAQTTRASAAQMRAAEALGQVDSLALWSPVQTMTTTADEVLKKFVQMKPIVSQMNNGQKAILGILANFKDGTADFTDAMTSKMPFLYKYVGEYYGNSMATTVANTIKEYQTPPPQSVSSSSW
jgi:hypothetical protein